jgi:monoamine oxidase
VGVRVSDWDVLIVGAGVSGLSAFRALSRTGLRVACLEARERIGGRIETIHDPASPVPIELGAEFIHGRAAEIWNLINLRHLAAYDCEEHAAYSTGGRFQQNEESWERISCVLDDIKRRASVEQDHTFASFLDQSSYPANLKQWVTSYVEGFNAARAEVVGIASLAEDARAAEKIDGGHSFRILNGYDAVPAALIDGIEGIDKRLRLCSVVETIQWEPGSARVHVKSRLTGERHVMQAPRVILTVPLGVLQAEPDGNGAIRFDPEPVEVLRAARQLRFGQVFRLVLRFQHAFWAERPELANAGFFLSQEPMFPTWWTTLPVHSPILTGWSAGPHADELVGKSKEEIVRQALSTLRNITGLTPAALEAAYFHNWRSDPFARGAYSYVPAGALPAREKLAEPVGDTLFFAGEATNLDGHSATVHGAIASGTRTARNVLQQR